MDIIDRLHEIANAIADANYSELTMRIPAEPDRDADLVVSSAAREIARLRAELAECREDAERWRYLRDDGCGFEITVREENEDGYESWVSGYPGAELDAAIDAARKGEGE